MKQFMDKDFLLSTPTAQDLFHDCADKMPIVLTRSTSQVMLLTGKNSRNGLKHLKWLSVIRCITGATLNYRDTSAITAC